MIRNLPGLTILFVGLLLCSCSVNRGEITSLSVTKGFTIEKLISRLPAQDDFEREYLFGSMMRFGSDGIQRICQKINTEDDSLARYALHGLATYVNRPGAEKERKQFVKGIDQTLKSDPRYEASAFLIGQLQFAGEDRAVELLGAYLIDPRLCEPATQTLLTIATPAAEKQVLDALPTVRGSNLVTIIKALGEFQSLDAISQIQKYAGSKNRDIKIASLQALANMGNPASKDTFTKYLNSSSGFDGGNGNTLLLLYAQRVAENGDQNIGAEICRSLIQNRNVSIHVQIAALGTLVDILGEAAQPDLLSVVESGVPIVQIAAIDLANRIPGQNQTIQWTEKIDGIKPRISARILQMLGERGDETALSAVRRAIQSEDQTIQNAAIKSAVILGGTNVISELLRLLSQSHDPVLIKTIMDQLSNRPSSNILRNAAEQLPDATTPAKIAILKFIASRNATEYSDLVFREINQGEPKVKITAIKAFENVGSEKDFQRLIAMLLDSENKALQPALQNTIAGITKNSPKQKELQSHLLSKFVEAAPEQKKSLLPIIGRNGGKEDITVVVSEVQNTDPAIKDAAIRALASWPDQSAIEPLLLIASSDSSTYQVLALRGCARIAGAADLSAIEKIDIYNKILAIANRPEEKKLALSGLAEIKRKEALRSLMQHMSDDSLSLEASLASISIASTVGPHSGELDGLEIAQVFIEEMVEPKVYLQLNEILNQDKMNRPPKGFTALFNGRDLDGWKGLVENPVKRAQMSQEELAQVQVKADSIMKTHWKVEDGILTFDGDGFHHLCTTKDYSDFEMLVDWKIEKNGDSGLYLRGSPQVQIWDPEQWKIGSGGLYNNQKGPSEPLVIADHPIGEWNTFRIKMVGDRVTIHLNGVLVVDNVVLENYWERDKPIYSTGQIELQAHNSPLYFRSIYIREIPREEPLFKGELFNGKDLTGWQPIGSPEGSWQVKDGILFTDGKGGGWLSTTNEFDNFKLELEFRVPEGGNSGVFLRAPHEGDPAYTGMEIQVLDDYAEKYANLKAWQYTGSIYAIQAPSSRASKKANQWQKMIIVCNGPKVTVILNGVEIINTNLIDFMHKEKSNPGIKRRKGFIGLQNHSTKIEYRNIRLQELEREIIDNK